MRVHVLQHDRSEGPAEIGRWCQSAAVPLSVTYLYLNETPPKLESFDLLVVMGGPMGTYDEAQYPWLRLEKQFIESAIKADKALLGVCLGSQLLAEVLGGRVYPGPEKEVGWFEVTLSNEACLSPYVNDFPTSFTPLHWHGDTFDLPAGCRHLASSATYFNQAFEFQARVIGFQFHLELGPEEILKFSNFGEAKLPRTKCSQSFEEIVANVHRTAETIPLLHRVLERFSRQVSRQ